MATATFEEKGDTRLPGVNDAGWDVQCNANAMHDRTIEDKLADLARQIGWVVIVLVALPPCIFGVYIAFQYRNNACVTDAPGMITLDVWLAAACFLNLVCLLAVLMLLCCHAPAPFRALVIGLLYAINVVWQGVGVGVLAFVPDRCTPDVLSIVAILEIAFVLTLLLLIGTTWLYSVCRRPAHRYAPVHLGQPPAV